jgi:hypothetical protein
LREAGLDRLPIPGLRVGCGLFTLNSQCCDLNDGLDFAMQELNAEVARARRSNRGACRLEMRCEAPRVKSSDFFPAAGAPRPDYLPKLEQRIAREGFGERVWQVLLCRMRWRSPELGRGGNESWSLGDLISRTNPRVGELTIRNQAQLFSTLWAERYARFFYPSNHFLCGVFGASLALVLDQALVNETTLHRYLQEFVTSRKPTLIAVAQVNAIACVGTGTYDLLDVLSLGPSFLSWGWNAGSVEPINLISISVDDLQSFRRITASRRVPNLSALLASRRRGRSRQVFQD